jgi:hypothetical protein
MTDDYEADRMAQQFVSFRHAHSVLETERRRQAGGLINIERLMTRLANLMPYDFEHGADQELSLLLYELKRVFKQKIEEAKTAGGPYEKQLAAFARYCVETGVNCITFNYDDFFDKALWEVKRTTITSTDGENYWHPDGGYGFFCRPSILNIYHEDIFMDRTSMVLLKLHGSINWYPRRGQLRPYSVDAIFHHEPWLPMTSLAEARGITYTQTSDIVAQHLESESFMIPPVLTKSALVEQPVLRMVWSQAYKILLEAESVVFVGYSLPITDIAASFMFGETLQRVPPPIIKVVNLAQGESAQNAVKHAYRRVLPEVSDAQFDFRNAIDWVKDVVAEQETPFHPTEIGGASKATNQVEGITEEEAR